MKIILKEALEKIARNIRKGILESIYYAGSGHPGGSLSCADILTVLYFNQMNIDPKKPDADARDKFILSKGHCAPAIYATLAEKGFFKKDELVGLRKFGKILQGHPDWNLVPGIDASSGSLGQGLSVANGMALTSKMNNAGQRIYCLVGDGELQEGQIWEAVMTSSKYKLDNLCLIVDNNNLQLDGNIEEIKGLNCIPQKFMSFGFNVIEIDGHNINQLLDAFESAKCTKGKPTVIIAKTIKGKGVSFMENKIEWHGKAPTKEEYELAISELDRI